jgi:hypothetical protein
MTRSILVVARRERTLYTYARDHFAGRPDIAVILDRRIPPDRRRVHVRVQVERRRDRRRVHVIDPTLSTRGFAVVTVR